MSPVIPRNHRRPYDDIKLTDKDASSTSSEIALRSPTGQISTKHNRTHRTDTRHRHSRSGRLLTQRSLTRSLKFPVLKQASHEKTFIADKGALKDERRGERGKYSLGDDLIHEQDKKIGDDAIHEQDKKEKGKQPFDSSPADKHIHEEEKKRKSKQNLDHSHGYDIVHEHGTTGKWEQSFDYTILRNAISEASNRAPASKNDKTNESKQLPTKYTVGSLGGKRKRKSHSRHKALLAEYFATIIGKVPGIKSCCLAAASTDITSKGKSEIESRIAELLSSFAWELEDIVVSGGTSSRVQLELRYFKDSTMKPLVLDRLAYTQMLECLSGEIAHRLSREPTARVPEIVEFQAKDMGTQSKGRHMFKLLFRNRDVENFVYTSIYYRGKLSTLKHYIPYPHEILKQGFHLKTLAEKLRTLYYDPEAKMVNMRNAVQAACPFENPSSVIAVFVHFNLDFLQKFMNTHYPKKNAKLGSAITLSGSALFCQATTCRDYLRTTWPHQGYHVLEALQLFMDDKNALFYETDKGLPSGIAISFPTEFPKKRDIIRIFGSLDTIVEALQILAWFRSAFQVSHDKDLHYSEVILSRKMPHFTLDTVQLSLVDEEKMCWLPLFKNSRAVIAKGFPIPTRENDELGIEMPLELMAALSNSDHAVSYKGGIVMKSFSSLLVPIRRLGNSIQWHMIMNEDGRHMKYSRVDSSFPSRLYIQDLNHSSLLQNRSFLGWWEISESNLGTEKLNYQKISGSKARYRTQSAIKLTSFSMGVQNIATASLGFSIRVKEHPVYIKSDGPLELMLDSSAAMSICLYDTSVKRSWLVSGTEIILCLIHMKKQTRTDSIIKPATVLEFAKNTHDGARACREAIMKMASLKINCDSDRDFYVRDLVTHFLSRLETLQISIGDGPGLSMRPKYHQRIVGFDIMDLASSKAYIRKREVCLERSHGGWPAMIKESDSIVLLASNLGDLITPCFENNTRATLFTSLPNDRDFLATTVRRLSYVFDQHDKDETLTLCNLQVHKTSRIPRVCECGGRRKCRCQHLFQIMSKKAASLRRLNTPGNFVPTGCIIVGTKPRSLVPWRQKFSSLTTLTDIIDTFDTEKTTSRTFGIDTTPPLRHSNELKGKSVDAPQSSENLATTASLQAQTTLEPLQNLRGGRTDSKRANINIKPIRNGHTLPRMSKGSRLSTTEAENGPIGPPSLQDGGNHRSPGLTLAF